MVLNYLYSKLYRVKVEALRGVNHLYTLSTGKPLKRTVFVTKSLLVGGQFRPGELKVLLDWGVTGIVSMRRRYPKMLDRQTNVAFLNLPTQDWHAPTLLNLDKGVRFITHHLENGGKVYVHCRWGEGRGPSMAAAYLMSTGMLLEDALETIRKNRPFIHFSPVQKKRLQEFAALQNPLDYQETKTQT